MYIMIDNYDSFVYNLAAYFQELNEEIQVIRNDEIDLKKLKEMLFANQLHGIIISPGPKSPNDYGKSLAIIHQFSGKIPILGVCLGHQIIAHAFNGHIIKGERPMHGKVTAITHSGKNLFKNLAPEYKVTRYHSLIVSKKNLPETLQVEAYDFDGNIMAISHKNHPIYGIQFHPEAILTEFGHDLLRNFCGICKEWRVKNLI